MNETRSSIPRILGAAALIAALASGAVLAGPGPRPRHHGPGGPDDGMVLEHLEYRLELSDEQSARIRGIKEARTPAFQAMHEKTVAARLALFEAIHAETLDAQAIQAAAAAVGAVEGEFGVLRAELFQEIRTVLTPEQQAEATEMLSEMRAFREDHPGGFGHGGHPHGGGAR
jgi:Spy/CpxP family protein refolding chaperone